MDKTTSPEHDQDWTFAHLDDESSAALPEEQSTPDHKESEDESFEVRLDRVKQVIDAELDGHLIGLKERLLQELQATIETYKTLLSTKADSQATETQEESAAVTDYLETIPALLQAEKSGKPIGNLEGLRVPLTPDAGGLTEQLNHIVAMIDRVMLLQMGKIAEQLGKSTDMEFSREAAADEYRILPQMSELVDALQEQLLEAGCTKKELEDAKNILTAPAMWQGTRLNSDFNRTAFSAESMSRLNFKPSIKVTAAVPLWLRLKIEGIKFKEVMILE